MSNDSYSNLSWKSTYRNISPQFWLLLVLLCLFSYFRGIDGEFVFDDNALIANDQFYANESNPLKCWDRGFWSDGRGGLYRPVVVFSYWLNVKAFGLNPLMFRAVNLLMHISVVFLVYLLTQKMHLGKTCAMLASMLYAVHPIHSEAVIPAFGRAELLCAIFLLLALIFNMRRTSSLKSPVAAGFFFLLALWSKEHAIIFIPLCLIYDFLSGKIKDRRLPYKYFIYLIFLGLFMFSKYSAMDCIIPGKDKTEALVDNRLALCPVPERIASAIRIQGLALGKFAYPSNLSHDYSYAQLLPSNSIFDVGALITLISLSGFTALLIYLHRKKRRMIIFLVASYSLCVIPAGNFIIPAGTIFAERLTYIPSIWLCILLSLLFIGLARHIPFKISFMFFSACIFLLSCRCISRCNDWHDRMSLAMAGVTTSPKSIKTWENLAVQFEETGKYAEAVAACDIAIGIYPEDSSAYLKRGTYYTRLNKYEEAENDFMKAISLSPGNIQAKINLAIVMANTGRVDSAKQALRDILQKNPSQPAAVKFLEILENQ